jgi:hypothetical protein
MKTPSRASSPWIDGTEPGRRLIRRALPAPRLSRLGSPFGPELVIRGSEERLAPILMTALATGLALVPLALAGNKAGHEIEHPMAVLILGGLVTSTVLNLFLMPALYLAFGHGGRRGEEDYEPVQAETGNGRENAAGHSLATVPQAH